jgi:hypothetical protein
MHLFEEEYKKNNNNNKKETEKACKIDARKLNELIVLFHFK